MNVIVQVLMQFLIHFLDIIFHGFMYSYLIDAYIFGTEEQLFHELYFIIKYYFVVVGDLTKLVDIAFQIAISNSVSKNVAYFLLVIDFDIHDQFLDMFYQIETVLEVQIFVRYDVFQILGDQFATYIYSCDIVD